MAYDYHWDSSDAGAITPLTWLDQVATYAESVLPAKKIMMGLPWYGYDWPSSGTGATVNYSSATQRAQANNATISRDAVSGEATFTYNGRTVYFQDAAAYTAKLDMLKQKHGSIGGFAHWAAGDEDPAIWNVIKGTVTTTPTTPPPSGSNPATPAPTDFALTGASVLSVKQGTTASADYRVIAINGFNSTASVNASVLSPGFIGTVSATPSVSPSAPATLQVTPSRSTAPGVYQISVKATSGTMVREQLVNVTVTAATATKQRAAKH
jgi:hypothetical protein